MTFCPLCNTALVFDRRLDGEVLQIAGETLVGPFAGTKLAQIPAAIVAYEEAAAWRPLATKRLGCAHARDHT